MQPKFGDSDGLGQRKKTLRELFLNEMDQVVLWKRLMAQSIRITRLQAAAAVSCLRWQPCCAPKS